MLSRVREWLALVLVGFLPFHALFVTVLTNLIAGPGHAPLGILALWKEAVLLIVLILAFLEIIIVLKSQRSKLKAQSFNIDTIDVCILIGIIYALSLLIAHSSQLTAFFIGFKYDFLPLVAFSILRRVSWSAWFQETVIKVLLIVGAIVALYGIVTFFLPMSFFTWLGYSDLHSLYQADGPLAAFQQIGGSSLRRIQSTMSGPNQLGVWLLIPFGILLAKTFSQKEERRKMEDIRATEVMRLLSFIVCLPSIVLTFSRAAWIGAIAMVSAMFWQKIQRKSLVVWWFTGVVVLTGIAIALAPQVLIRRESFLGHIEKPLSAIQTIIAHPLGLGLGTAGPASNRTSDTCIDQPAGSDISWANDRPDLCVFVDGTQVQPTNRACSCPMLTENWYLQWGVEMGIFGFVLSVMLALLVLRKLIMENGQLTMQFSIFLAVSIASLFLHAWEDSAVALTIWMTLVHHPSLIRQI